MRARCDRWSGIWNPKSSVSSPLLRQAFRPKEWNLIQRLRTPRLVQRYLRALPYNWEKGGETLRTLRGVAERHEAHCLEAALAAATILEQHGYPPVLLDLESQDLLDHVLFLFRESTGFGAVARSRDAGLHGRRPVFRTLRSLVMSYMDPYVDGSGRVVGYGVLDLRSLRRCDWRLSARNVWAVERTLIHMSHVKLRMPERRYRSVLRQFLSFKTKYPDRPVTFYSSRRLWL
ncbi:MAG: hypothetical protein ACRD2G_13455 [Terriglobia bacterium]